MDYGEVYHAPLYFIPCYNGRNSGMTGFDGGGCARTASREAPNSKTQRKPLSANRTDYAALPLAA